MSTSSGSDNASAIKSLRARPRATIICENSRASTWINFLKNEVPPLLKDRENNIMAYHSPIGFKNAKARNNYINHLKTVMEEVPEKEQEDLKQLIDKDFGSLKLATNAGRDVKTKQLECRLLSTVFVILTDSWVLIGFD
jgi:hypothetical protein